MPGAGGPSSNLAQYINDVQTRLTETMLSRSDAALSYETKESADAIIASVNENTTAIGAIDTTSSGSATLGSPLAPPGQRDSWQGTGSVLTSGRFRYFAGFDKIFVSATGSLSYSSDGGATFAPCVFDIAPIGLPQVSANSTIVVVVTFEGETYTSSNGINFTKGQIITPIADMSYNIIWYKGLFIVGDNTAVGRTIITSPDGINWTHRSSTLIHYTFAASPDIIVSVGPTAPYAAYSIDGITWSGTTSVLTSTSSVAWSPEKNEFLLITSAGVGFVSSDGASWTSVGSIGRPNLNDQLFWVADDINRWYFAAVDTAGNYSLWSTPDARIAFVGSNLDGSIIKSHREAARDYSASRKSFMIGLTSTPFFVYSTQRPNDLKSISDNTRVRGSPVATSKYSGGISFAITNTTTETTIVPSTSIGSLVYQASQPVGMRIKFAIGMANTSAAGDTLTLRFKSQAGTLTTHPIVVGAGASALATRVKGSFVVYASTISALTMATQSGVLSTLVSATPAYNRAIQNTFSITAQWGAALSTCTITQFNVSTSFINGA